MTAFANLSELVNRLTGGNSGNPQFPTFHRESRVGGAAAAAPIVGQPISLWQYEGYPSHGAAPTGSAVYPDNTTQGGLLQTDPSGGRQLWLPGGFAVASAQGVLTVWDRLAHFGGLSGTSTSAQTVNLTPTRSTDGVGVRAFLEVNTQVGATGTTIAMHYHNRAAAAKTGQSVVWGGTNRREAQRWVELSLAAGDDGVTSVEDVQAAGTTGTAGDFAVVIARKITSFPIATVSRGVQRSFLDNLKEVLTDACLFFTWLPATTTAPIFDADLVLVER